MTDNNFRSDSQEELVQPLVNNGFGDGFTPNDQSIEYDNDLRDTAMTNSVQQDNLTND